MSKIESYLFPFRYTFQRLELENRWWHRLAVVLFFTVLIPISLYLAVVSYLLFYPTYDKIPEIVQWGRYSNQTSTSARTGDIFDQLARDPDTLPAAKGQSGGQSSPSGANVKIDPDSIKPLSQSPPPPPDGSGVLATTSSEYISPIPANAIVGSDSYKTIQMPDGTTSTFPIRMSDDSIKTQWTHQLHRQIFFAILLSGLVAVLCMLIISYIVQATYRALLYVIYGANPMKA